MKTAGMEKRRSTEQRNTVTMGVTATQNSTFEWRKLGAQVRCFARRGCSPTRQWCRCRIPAKQGYFWAIARDFRSPAVVYSYAPGRAHQHATASLGHYRGVLQSDGYATYRQLVGHPGAPHPLG